jgi:hypothetical protein
MTGMLTPIPHTPLAQRLRDEGRLREAEFSGNNTDDEVQFVPRRMSMEDMQRGYLRILERLFSPGAMYERSRALLERLEPHIFHGRQMRPADLRAGFRSLWRQGIVRASRRDYFGLLLMALRRDLVRFRAATRAAADLTRRLFSLSSGDQPRVGEQEAEWLSSLVDRAREALVRARPEQRFDEVATWATTMRAAIASRALTTDDRQTLYRWSREYFVRQRRQHRFPGAYFVKAVNLAIKGLHYEIVMHGIVREAERTRHAGDSGERTRNLSDATREQFTI